MTVEEYMSEDYVLRLKAYNEYSYELVLPFVIEMRDRWHDGCTCWQYGPVHRVDCPYIQTDML